jgi:sec-independent protein translocase protein TatB
MIDLGVSKIALIGAVALIVIGPEKLPRVARTVGTLLGKAQRYVNDVKSEVNRSMELDELKKMKETMEGAARDVEGSFKTHASDFEKSWSEATSDNSISGSLPGMEIFPEYKHPKKKWRLKTGRHAAVVQGPQRHPHQGTVRCGPRSAFSSSFQPRRLNGLTFYLRCLPCAPALQRKSLHERQQHRQD